MLSPVAGLRPFLADLLVTENVPKPTSVTLSPAFKVLVTPSIKDFRAAVACTFVSPTSPAILLTNPALFIVVHCEGVKIRLYTFNEIILSSIVWLVQRV